MLVAVILGNRLNDDGSATDVLIERLNLALEIENKLHPNVFIVSGGVANPVAEKSEAQVMKTYLASHGVDAAKIFREDKSLTTKQNAKFSVPLAAKLGATHLLLCTSPEHMHRSFLNPQKLFAKQLKKYPNIVLKTCCTREEILPVC